MRPLGTGPPSLESGQMSVEVAVIVPVAIVAALTIANIMASPKTTSLCIHDGRGEVSVW